MPRCRRRSINTPEERNKKIDGLTPEQRFFLSFAAIWRSKIRDEDQKLRLTTDPHSPAQFRVNGPLANMPEFQKAFNVPDGSAMVRPADKRVNIWYGALRAKPQIPTTKSQGNIPNHQIIKAGKTGFVEPFDVWYMFGFWSLGFGI